MMTERRRGEESEDDEEEFQEEPRKKPVWKRVLSLLTNDQSGWSTGFGRDIVGGSRGAAAAAASSSRFIIHPDNW